jgi:hypothetical protein
MSLPKWADPRPTSNIAMKSRPIVDAAGIGVEGSRVSMPHTYKYFPAVAGAGASIVSASAAAIDLPIGYPPAWLLRSADQAYCLGGDGRDFN